MNLDTTERTLTIVNFKVPRENFVYSNDKRASIQLGKGQLSVPTKFIYPEGQDFASVGIVKEWDYFYSSAPKQGKEIAGAVVISSLQSQFEVLPKKDAFSIATRK